jgi:hypothetical protein
MDEGVGITVYINVVQVSHTDSCNICNRTTATRELPSMDGCLIGSPQQAHTTMKSGPYSLPSCAKKGLPQTGLPADTTARDLYCFT